jgi:predicted dienelactone hydrolase
MTPPGVRPGLGLPGALALLLALTLSSSALGFGGSAPAPDAPGPWAVGHTTFELVDPDRGDRLLPIEAWYPADPEDAVGEPTQYPLIPLLQLYLPSPLAIDDIPVLARPWMPLVVFSHGSGGLNIQSTGVMEILASHGFVVVAPSHTGNTIWDSPQDPFPVTAVNRPLDVSLLIDHMLERGHDPADPFFFRISPFSIGVVGHSFGGYTALAMAAGLGDQVPPDPRVRAIVPTSAVTAIHTDEELESIEIPTMLIGGTLDDVIPIDPDTIRGFELISSRHLYRADIVGAGHYHFANVCEIGNALIDFDLPIEVWPLIEAGDLVPIYDDACTPGVYPIDEARRIQALYTVAFFRRHLYMDLRYARFLRERYAEANEPDVIYFDASPWRCGNGAEMALILPPLIWLGRRTRGSRGSRVK